jgi:hypothetical protein
MRAMNRTWLKAGLVLGLGLAIVAPAAAFAASPPAAQTTGSTRHTSRVDAIAKALQITPQQVRTAVREGAIKELAKVAKMTPAQVKAKLKGIKMGPGMRVAKGRRMGRAALGVGFKAVASQLQMTPQQLRQAVRNRNLQLPAGTTVQSLQTTAQTAVSTWLQGLAAKHPKLTAQRQQQIAQRVATVVGKVLTRATTPASGSVQSG